MDKCKVYLKITHCNDTGNLSYTFSRIPCQTAFGWNTHFVGHKCQTGFHLIKQIIHLLITNVYICTYACCHGGWLFELSSIHRKKKENKWQVKCDKENLLGLEFAIGHLGHAENKMKNRKSARNIGQFPVRIELFIQLTSAQCVN